MMDIIDAKENIQKISIDMENMAYQISSLIDEVATLHAEINEIKERK